MKMEKIKLTDDANINYVAQIVKIDDKDWYKHPNADKLKLVDIGMNTVLTGIDAKPGYYVYFPIGCSISNHFLHETNSYERSDLNKDMNVKGYFNKHGRVKALRLRGVPSMGYIVPVEAVMEVYGNFNHNNGEMFNYIGGEKFVWKYVPRIQQSQGSTKKQKGGSEPPRLKRLIDGQVHFHVATTNFRNVIYNVGPEDMISVTYKLHGTSGWAANILVKKEKTWWEKLFKMDYKTEYDIVYGSRKTVKNKYFDNPNIAKHFYGDDIWGIIKEEISETIPKGYTLYYEITGYTPSGAQIQKHFDYGSRPNEHKVWIYRITYTNPDGFVTELSHAQIMDFCKINGLTPVPLRYVGYAKNLFPEISVDKEWNKNFAKRMIEVYTDKDCSMHTTGVPEEGVVLRVQNLYRFLAYKVKSFRFLELEDKGLDKGETNIEDNQ